jgi:hypothetical protein
MVLHPRHALDHRGHTGQRPQIGSKTVNPRALAEVPVNLAKLGLRQFWFPAGPTRSTHPIRPVLSPGFIPAAHALTSYLQFAGDRCQDQFASRKQPSGTLATQFHGMEIAPRRGRHNSIMHPSDTDVTLLCEAQ